jgi:hypothetical protein
MSDSTTNLDLISSSQAQKEVTANSLFDAASPAMLFGRRASTSAALTWGYYGGVIRIGSTLTAIPNGTVVLSPSATNYVEVDPATGTVSVNTSAFTAGRMPLYAVVAGASTVSSYTDQRTLASMAGGLSDGDKGDVIVSGSGSTFTIDSAVLSGFGRTLTATADNTAARTLLGVGVGTDVQAYDAELTAIAGLTSAANKGIQFTGAGTAATFDLTAAGKALIDDADAAAQRVTLGLGTVVTLASDTDATLSANSDTRIATQKATKAYVDSVVTGGAADVMIFKGVIGCSANPNYPAADAGNLYKVSVPGKIGGASGPNVEAGDTLYCITDGAAAGDHATVGAQWVISQVNVDGAVVGPASAVGDHVALFSGSTGKIIKDSGLTLTGANSGDETAASIGTLIHGAAGKTTPIDTDEFGLSDSAASNVLKKLTWANIKATLKTYFDTLYAPQSQPFDLTAFYPGAPVASAIVTRVPLARAVSFPSSLTGSVGKAAVAATAQTDFDLQKNGASVGTLRFAAAGTSATFIAASAISFAAGDVLSIISPASADTTLADIGFVLAGTR